MCKSYNRKYRLRRKLIFAAMFVATWLLLSPVVSAVEEEIYFQSDYQQEIKDEQVLILQGSVEVHFREVVIYADEVRLNDEKDEFFGVGNVHLVGADRDIYSDSIWYNYASDDFDMRNARGSMLVQNVGEPVWFEAERLKGNVNDYKMINGRITTCTPTEHREYHIEARMIKVLPDNKIIFRNGYIFILNIPVLWFPFWSYSIAETPWQIDVGKRAGDGVYINSRYNYLAEELIIGALLFNYYSQRGWRFGAEHQYVLPRHGQGSLTWSYLYGTYRGTEGDVIHANEYSVNLSQQFRFGSRFSGRLQFSSSSGYNPRNGRNNLSSGSVSSTYNTANTNTGVNLTMRRNTGYQQTSTITSGFTHSRTVFENVTSSTKVDYTVTKQNNSGAADEDFRTNLEFRQNLTGWNWTARVDTHWDPDGNTFRGDASRPYTDKLPEIDVTFQQNAFQGRLRNLLGFQMQTLNLRGGLYYIGPENKERNGFYGRMDTRFNRNFDFGPSHNIQSNITFWQAISSTGDARYVYSTQANWTWDIAKKIKWNVTWNRSDNEGRIPFTGSGLDNSGTPNNRLGWSLNYTNGRLYTVKLSTSYVLSESFLAAPNELWTMKRIYPMRIDVTYNPSTRLSCTLGGSYDLHDGRLKDASSRITLTDNASYNLTTNITFDPPGTFTRIGSKATFIIGDDWDFDVSTEFGSQATGSFLRTIQATHRLDCSFVSLQYTASNDFWSVYWGVSAFPSGHLGWSSTEDAFGPNIFNNWSGSGGGFQGGGGLGFNYSGTGGSGYPSY